MKLFNLIIIIDEQKQEQSNRDKIQHGVKLIN